MEVASTEVLRHRMPQLKLGLLEHTLAPGEGLNLPVRDLLENLRNNPEWRKLLLGGNVDDLMAAVLSKTRAALREPKVASADPAPVNYGTVPGSETRLMDYEAAKRKWKAVKDPHSPEAQVAAAKADALKKVGPPSMAKKGQFQKIRNWARSFYPAEGQRIDYGALPDFRVRNYNETKAELEESKSLAGQDLSNAIMAGQESVGPAGPAYAARADNAANSSMDRVGQLAAQVKILKNIQNQAPSRFAEMPVSKLPETPAPPTGDVQVAKTP